MTPPWLSAWSTRVLETIAELAGAKTPHAMQALLPPGPGAVGPHGELKPLEQPIIPRPLKTSRKYRASGPGGRPLSTERHAARMCRVPCPIRSYVYALVPFQASQ